MSAELIKKITQAENSAAENYEQTKKKAKQIIAQATEDAKREYDQRVLQANAQAKSIVVAAKASAENETKTVFEKNKQECDAIKSKAKSNINKAIDIIIAKVVR